jgi:hypothetical protein
LSSKCFASVSRDIDVPGYSHHYRTAKVTQLWELRLTNFKCCQLAQLVVAANEIKTNTEWAEEEAANRHPEAHLHELLRAFGVV